MLFLHFAVIGIFTCLVSGAESVSLPAPRNLLLNWENEFCRTLSWQAPQENFGTCMDFHLTVQIGESEHKYIRKVLKDYERCISTERTVNYTLRTRACEDGPMSEPVNIIVEKHIEHIEDFNCFLYSSKDMNCSWRPAKHITDLQLYYRRDSNNSRTAACTEYLYEHGVKAGCHLWDAEGFESKDFQGLVFFLFNGTLNGSPIRNTFKKTSFEDVKPPPPQLNITQEGKNLVLSWAPPDVFDPDCWVYSLMYHKCGESHPHPNKMISGISTVISYDPMCKYQVQITAVVKETCGHGRSDPSPIQTYGQDDHYTTVVAIVVPVIVVICLIFVLVCLRKYKSRIFPDIPVPEMIFKDMMNNSKESKNPIGNLYVPVQEEVYILLPEKVGLNIHPETNTLPSQTNRTHTKTSGLVGD